MESWSKKVGHRINKVLEDVDADLARELQDRDRVQHAFLTQEVERLNASLAQVVQEKHLLQDELRDLREQHQDCLAPHRKPLGEITVNTVAPRPPDPGPEKPDYEKELVKLVKKHEKLKDTYAKVRKVAANIRHRKEQWRVYAEKLEGKIERLQNGSGNARGPSDRRGSIGAPSSIAQTIELLPEEAEVAAEAASCSHQDLTVVQASREANQSVLDGGSRSANPPGREESPCHTQTRDLIRLGFDEANDPAQLPRLPIDKAKKLDVTVKQEPSSDGPVVVSERKVRKRKISDDFRSRSSRSNRRIKQQDSSDAIVTDEGDGFTSQESMDLDEVLALKTPRKPQPARPRSTVENDYGSGTRCVSRVDSLLSGRAGVETIAVESVMPSWILAHGVTDVSEDGEGEGLVPANEAGHFHTDSARQEHGGKLEALLNGSRAGVTPLGSAWPLKAPRTAPSRLENTESVPDFTRQSVENARLGADNINRRPELSVKPIPRTPIFKNLRPKQAPLRGRTLSELKPEDFKINPALNDGYKFAYDEVIRGKAERARIPGCVAPDCCGPQFRMMAMGELGGNDLSMVTNEAGTRLLVDALGQQAFRLPNMTPEEKRDIWIEARMRELSNKLNTHRLRFDRRPSPPGIWNAEFPNTQETNKNKKEAEKMERRIVRERYKEAMRGHGKWLFKDE